MILFLLLNCINFLSAQEVTNITPGNANLQYTGRINLTSTVATMYYAGTYITTKFQGTSLKATLKDASGTNTMGFMIDGGAMIVKSGITSTAASYTVATGLTNATHDLIIVKRRGPTANLVEFRGLTLDVGKGLVAPAARPTRRIEVFGNSISAGTNADNTATTDPGTAAVDNGWNAYTNRLARLLGAEIHNNGIPGIAIQSGYGYYAPSAATNYANLCPINGSTTAWSFANYTPDLVLMAYGVNDENTGALGDASKITAWKTAYKTIINDLLSKYTAAHFILCVPPMNSDRATVKTALQGIVSELNNARVHFYGFTAAPTTYGHPNNDMHIAMANELNTYVSTLGIFGAVVNDRFVSTTGSDTNNGSSLSPWKTIAYAASQLQSGQTLRIKAGAYLETAKVIFTSGRSNITVMADDAANRPTIDFNDRNNVNSRFVVADGINYFTWDGVNIKNAGGSEKGAINFGTWYATNWSTSTRQTNIVIKNCDITYAYNAAVRWMYCDNVTIDNVYGYECAQINADRKDALGHPHVILGYWSDNVTIKNSRIIQNHGEGLGPFVGCSNWLMENNTAADNYAINYYVDTEMGSCTVRNNVAYNTGYSVSGGSANQIACGVRIANEVSDLPYNAYDPAKFLVQNVKIYNNFILNCKSGIEAFQYSPGFKFQLSNSFIANNTIATTTAGSFGVYFTVPGTFDVKNNIIYNTSGVTITGTATASNNSTANPSFVTGTGTAAANYKLSSGSASINAGTTVTGVTTDYWGTARPTGASYDIGAHEYAGTVANVPVTGVAVNPTTATVAVNGTVTLAAIVAPGNATTQTVTWSSSNTAIATVSTTGVVTGIATGSATITVTTNDGAKTATCAITVTSATSGSTIVIRALGTKGDETIELRVDNVSVATYTLTTTLTNYSYSNYSGTHNIKVAYTNDGTGRDARIDYITVGSTTIQAESISANTGAWNSATSQCGGVASEWMNCNGYIDFGSQSGPVANVPVTGVTVSPTTASVAVNGTVTLTATVAPSNATTQTVTWSSSNTTIATVSTTGVVTGKAAGAATITVTTNDGAKTATCAITVTAASTVCTGNKLLNGSFESGTTSWVDWGNFYTSTDASDGTKAAYVGTWSGGFYQDVTTTSGTTLNLSFYSKVTGSPISAEAGLAFFDAAGTELTGGGTITVTNTAYTLQSLTATAPANTAKVRFWVWKGDNFGAMYLDNICLVTGQAGLKSAKITVVDNNTLQSSVVIYPNPVGNVVNIQLDSEMPNIKVSVYSIQGQMLFNNTYHSVSKISLNAEAFGLQKGTYIIKVDSGNEQFIRRIIKK